MQSLELWNMSENKTMTLSAHEGLIAGLALSTVTGLVASASHDKIVKLWKWKKKQETRNKNVVSSVVSWMWNSMFIVLWWYVYMGKNMLSLIMKSSLFLYMNCLHILRWIYLIVIISKMTIKTELVKTCTLSSSFFNRKKRKGRKIWREKKGRGRKWLTFSCSRVRRKGKEMII